MKFKRMEIEGEETNCVYIEDTKRKKYACMNLPEAKEITNENIGVFIKLLGKAIKSVQDPTYEQNK